MRIQKFEYKPPAPRADGGYMRDYPQGIHNMGDMVGAPAAPKAPRKARRKRRKAK